MVNNAIVSFTGDDMKFSFETIVFLKVICCLFYVVVMSVQSEVLSRRQVTSDESTLILSFLWPPGFCMGRNCKQKPKRFVVGELSLEPPGEKRFPRVPDYIFKEYGADLHKYWPDLRTEEGIWVNEDYYRKKYETEGASCNMTVEQYFDVVTSLAKKHADPLLQLMNKDKIEPSDSPYNLLKIISAISSYTRRTVAMMCEEHDGSLYVVQIFLCINPQNLHFMHCTNVIHPPPTQTCWEEQVIFSKA